MGIEKLDEINLSEYEHIRMMNQNLVCKLYVPSGSSLKMNAILHAFIQNAVIYCLEFEFRFQALSLSFSTVYRMECRVKRHSHLVGFSTNSENCLPLCHKSF